MCFSATASFGSGILLSVVGIASLKKVQHRSQFVFAAIPLLFAIQQFLEGILWLALSLPNLNSFQRSTTFFFLFFAQIVWPVYVPISILLLEKHKTRRTIQRLFVGIGILVSSHLIYCLCNYEVYAKIDCYHIMYIQSYPERFRNLTGVLYGITIIIPPFFSHIRRMWLLGITILISYIVASLFYNNYLVSVWCFFASIVSISVWFIMKEIVTDAPTIVLEDLHTIKKTK